ncbi:MAG: hypothetical protein IKZ47_07135 [Clostridia bacterium]|nr:hypothetical protein [Clostridia bacterium]
MKKKIFILAASLCALIVFACAFAAPSAEVKAAPAAEENTALAARFQNMLNRNYVYNADFEDLDVITENSVLALLDRRDTDEPEYISEAVVTGFIKDMYGIEITDITQDESIYKEGYVYIVPRGFTSYVSTVKDIAGNEDGSFTVTSSVTVDPHDSEAFVTEAKTLFVPNEKSAFGYNIIYSDLKLPASDI